MAMRTLAALALAALAGCVAPASPMELPVPQVAAPPTTWSDVLLLSKPFVGSSTGTGWVVFDVPPGNPTVKLRIVLDTGVATRLAFQGLGECDGFEVVGGSVALVNAGRASQRDCGPVESGQAKLAWDADGYIQGTLEIHARVAASPPSGGR